MKSDTGYSGTPLHTICLWGKQLLNWDGGKHQLWLCAAGLQAAQPSLKIHILYPLRSPARILLGTLKLALLHVMRTGRLPERFDHASKDADTAHMVSGGLQGIKFHSYRTGNRAFVQKLEELGCQAVFCASESLGQSFPLPWVGYVADMQHIHLPQFFRKETLAARNERFRTMLLEAPALSVNSQDTANDVRKDCSDLACPVFVLPFAPVSGSDWFDADLATVAKKYRLPERFFLISNRFWIHKSHATAFDALKNLHSAAEFSDVELVCTGETRDTRWPDHFTTLQNRIAELGLLDKIRVLGRIPRQDQIAIMRLASAVVQPSLFEGSPGGFAVHEALAVGTRAIVSDTAVNREIDDSKVCFFKAGSQADLARAMREMLHEPYERPAIDQLQQQSREALRSVGEQILCAIEAARMTR